MGCMKCCIAIIEANRIANLVANLVANVVSGTSGADPKGIGLNYRPFETSRRNHV